MTINFTITYKNKPMTSGFTTNTIDIASCTGNKVKKLLREWLNKTAKGFNPMLIGDIKITCLKNGYRQSEFRGTGISASDPDVQMPFQKDAP